MDINVLIIIIIIIIVLSRALSFLGNTVAQKVEVIEWEMHIRSTSRQQRPQCSILGPLLFTMFVSLIASLLYHQYQYAMAPMYIWVISFCLPQNTRICAHWPIPLVLYHCLALNHTNYKTILIGTHQRCRTNCSSIWYSSAPWCHLLTSLSLSINMST